MTEVAAVAEGRTAAGPEWAGTVPLKTPVAAASATPMPLHAAARLSTLKLRSLASRDLPGGGTAGPAVGESCCVNAVTAVCSPASSRS